LLVQIKCAPQLLAQMKCASAVSIMSSEPPLGQPAVPHLTNCTALPLPVTPQGLMLATSVTKLPVRMSYGMRSALGLGQMPAVNGPNWLSNSDRTQQHCC
jgi:hypothetical protein